MLDRMGEVVSLTVRRAAKAAQDRIAAERTLHPSLRWVAGSAYWTAHARRDGEASCGAAGDLMLAPPGVPLCPVCYPQGGAARPEPAP